MIGSIGYSKDLCNEKLIEKESIERYGCTTPFVHDKSNIVCQYRSIRPTSHSIFIRMQFIGTILKEVVLIHVRFSQLPRQNLMRESGSTLIIRMWKLFFQK